MTPERMAERVLRWVRFYTRDLPTAIAQRRVDEIDADLHDHIAHERTDGISDRRIALRIGSRMVRGLAADVAWRRRQATSKRFHRSVVRVALATAFILLLPLSAMQLTGEVVWSLADFVVAGVLLGATGLLLELALRAGNLAYRAAAVLALATGFLLIWANLAVGVIGEPNEPANALYLAVLAVGVAGAVVARLRPEGMARALLATASAQAAVAVIALFAGKADVPTSSVSEIVAVNGLFVALFCGSALLFRHAARRQAVAARG